jgi:threonine dehydratase
MQATDLSGNELAKSHVRYLVGGRSDAENERLFAFEFPERQGALHKFLTTLQPGLNISLFHYRNYGGDVAKILAAIQCPAGEVSDSDFFDDVFGMVLLTGFSSIQEASLKQFLSELGYPWKEETENPTYKMFLRQ